MLKRFREEELLGRPLSEKQKKEIARAQSSRDEDIDTSDIPEVRELPAGRVPEGRPRVAQAFMPGKAARNSLQVPEGRLNNGSWDCRVHHSVPVQLRPHSSDLTQIRAVLPHAPRLLEKRAPTKLFRLLQELFNRFVDQLILGLPGLVRHPAKRRFFLLRQSDPCRRHNLCPPLRKRVSSYPI